MSREVAALQHPQEHRPRLEKLEIIHPAQRQIGIGGHQQAIGIRKAGTHADMVEDPQADPCQLQKNDALQQWIERGQQARVCSVAVQRPAGKMKGEKSAQDAGGRQKQLRGRKANGRQGKPDAVDQSDRRDQAVGPSAGKQAHGSPSLAGKS